MKKIIIIGSGLGGLTAGNLLAKKGYDVTIFESHVRPGGYTGGFWRKGYYFENGTHGLARGDVIFDALKKIGVYEKLTFHQHEPFRYVSEDFDCIPSNLREIKQMIHSAYPDKKIQIDRYFSVMDPIPDLMQKLTADASNIKKIIPAIRFGLFYLRYNKITKSEYANRIFSTDSRLHRLMSDFTGFPEMAIFLVATYFWGPFYDYWGIKGGMQTLADALSDKFKESGGKLKLKSKVTRIITNSKSITGVFANDEYYAAEYVIAACDYKKLFEKLIDPEFVPKKLTKKLKSANLCEGWVVVYLGLTISNNKLRDIMGSNYVIHHDLNEVPDIPSTEDKAYFDHCRLEMYSPSLMSPELSPEGKSSLMIMGIAPHHWNDNWESANREGYRSLKQSVANTLIQRATRIITNLEKIIEFQDMATPLTFERFTHNSEGAVNAWSWNPQKKFYQIPLSVHIKTPFKNLLIGSAWAIQYGGTYNAILAAKKCVKYIEKH